jgi:hypothetical protein
VAKREQQKFSWDYYYNSQMEGRVGLVANRAEHKNAKSGIWIGGGRKEKALMGKMGG